jgi:heptosyltransferase-2
MPASSESVSGDGAPRERVLICAVNWIGDSVMAMPAVQQFREAHPSAQIIVLVKPALRPLWQLHAAPDGIVSIAGGIGGTLRTAARVRAARADIAYILPHSFRSALIPWLARVPERRGLPGHARDWMLTRVARPREAPGRTHQAFEYLDLLMPERMDRDLPPPVLRVPEEARRVALERLSSVASPRVALLPGAARGPSKQWPPEHFVALGRLLTSRLRAGVVVLGSPAEIDLCGRVSAQIGAATLNLAGRTSLPDLIALLRACDLVVANDSGGLHLSAAVGTPLVALYGITDPGKTGPLGATCRVLQQSSVRRRDVPRDSEEARRSLAAIRPEQALEAAVALLGERTAREEPA